MRAWPSAITPGQRRRRRKRPVIRRAPPRHPARGGGTVPSLRQGSPTAISLTGPPWRWRRSCPAIWRREPVSVAPLSRAGRADARRSAPVPALIDYLNALMPASEARRSWSVAAYNAIAQGSGFHRQPDPAALWDAVFVWCTCGPRRWSGRIPHHRAPGPPEGAGGYSAASYPQRFRVPRRGAGSDPGPGRGGGHAPARGSPVSPDPALRAKALPSRAYCRLPAVAELLARRAHPGTRASTPSWRRRWRRAGGDACALRKARRSSRIRTA